MRKGKMCAQAAHASVKSLIDNLDMDNGWDFKINRWLEYGMPKIVVGIDSEDELFQLHQAAKEFGLNVTLIQDAGKTEFKEPTYTCIAIGPDEDHIVDKITRELKLL